MKLSESLSFDVYNMHAKAGKWVFRAPEFILKRGVYKFFASEPSSVVKNLPLGLKELIDGLTQLGEPPQVTDSLTQLLTPIVNTFPRSPIQFLFSF